MERISEGVYSVPESQVDEVAKIFIDSALQVMSETTGFTKEQLIAPLPVIKCEFCGDAVNVRDSHWCSDSNEFVTLSAKMRQAPMLPKEQARLMELQEIKRVNSTI